MATVTQLSSGSISSGTAVNLTGVSVIPGDLLVLFMSSVSSLGVSSISNLGNIQISNNLGLVNTGPFPDLRGDNWYAIQTATVTGQTITVNFSSSAPSVAIAFRVRPDEGNQLVVRQRRTKSSNTSSTVFSTPTINAQQGSIVIGGCAVHDNTFFTDTDTSGGSWSSVFYVQSTASTDIAVFGQTKIMNAQSNIAYNGSFPSTEHAVGYILEVVEQGIPYWGVLNL
jgi:hypothetical protein